MAIKKLQNNFTTQDQSKRLLELGVPADSADCFYSLWRGDVCTDEPFGPFIRGTVSAIDYQNDIPCWSVGRLIEIYVYLTSYEYVSLIFKKTFTPMDKILDKLEKDIANGKLDFSKLEK